MPFHAGMAEERAGEWIRGILSVVFTCQSYHLCWTFFLLHWDFSPEQHWESSVWWVRNCQLSKSETLMVLVPSLFEHDFGNVISILATAILIFFSSQRIWLFSQQSIWSRDYLPVRARSRLEVNRKSWTFPNDPRVEYNLERIKLRAILLHKITLWMFSPFSSLWMVIWHPD